MLHAPQYGKRKPLNPNKQRPNNMPKKILTAVLLLSLSGCSYLTTELRHTSHPTAGKPFGPRTEEDSLNTVNACAGRETGAWFIEQCLGYKLTDGGFYGPQLTYDLRVGRKWQLKH
jgi:hypothetical protein